MTNKDIDRRRKRLKVMREIADEAYQEALEFEKRNRMFESSLERAREHRAQRDPSSMREYERRNWRARNHISDTADATVLALEVEAQITRYASRVLVWTLNRAEEHKPGIIRSEEEELLERLAQGFLNDVHDQRREGIDAIIRVFERATLGRQRSRFLRMVVKGDLAKKIWRMQDKTEEKIEALSKAFLKKVKRLFDD
jgi:hypothetical protein